MKLKLCSKTKKIFFSIFLFFGVFAIQAQTLEISGTVSDENGVPLPGVTVVVKNTVKGTATDFDGKFTIENVQQGESLVFSFIGYKTIERTINNADYLNISLESESQNLDEIVVTALGIKREQKALGYAVQEIKGEALQRVQGIDAATSLSGKVAGVLVTNPTDFNAEPTITILGDSPLLVIDGIAYQNKTLNDIASEDIESLSVLKGATASALYGFRGKNGAVLIKTKNGSKAEAGVSVNLTTNTMFTAGYLAIPEKQSVYGRGENNTYQQNKDQSWGGLMDGSIQNQWDPIAKEYRDYPYLPVGKDNFKNFLEQGYITNNNVNVTFKENAVALRSSLNWTQNKGRYPNSKLDKYTYTFGGDINLDKFQLTSNLSYSRRYTPNQGSNGYTSYDPMYTLLANSSSDFNVLDYKDNYWLIPGVLQNNQFGYDLENNSYSGKNQNSPYFDRYERTNETLRDIFNADLSLSYDITNWLKATVRSGLDFYGDSGRLSLSQGSYTSLGDTGLPYFTYRSGLTFNGSRTGAYLVGKTTGFSSNSDLLLTGLTKFVDDKLELEYLAGGTIFYQKDENINATTVGGISVPGFFSLAASVNPATVAEERRARQVNSAFGRIALSWNKLIYLDITGRNDWSSTLAGPGIPASKKSYFYPSISSSFIVSELLNESTKSWLDLFKVRGSWSQSKNPASIYEINGVYTSVSSIWNDYSGSYAPSSLYDLNNVLPDSEETYEIGLQGMFFKKRLTADVTYANRRRYNTLTSAPLSSTSGYTSNVINTDEEKTRKSWIVALTGTPIKNENLQWDLGINWSTYKEVYSKLDDTYSSNRPWVKVGERTDAYTIAKYQTVPSGEFAGQRVFRNGLVERDNFSSVIGYKSPDWIWGMNTTLRYKNWSLFASLDGIVGGMSSSTTEAYMWLQGVHPGTLTPERALDVATPGSTNYLADGVMVVSGDYTTDRNTGEVIEDTRVFAPNDVPRTYRDYIRSIHGGTAWGGTGREEDIFDRTFFKLRELSITYTVPKNILSKWGPVKNASISFIGQNVLLWSKEFKYSDPDGGSDNFADPSSRYLGTSIKLSF
ncbi:SusC/RagA family TonB-linked outer membrane protein [Yeosuana marina]|uniref:SusC/RagA family TonB-linked outer membrane protein n=1 Tax=Yeosuana marina TaxID=1565536 RepID=UPI00141E06C4|nr:SusC/RagA family TonB-linked outer membrane protein [Yeosuana marina]